MLKHSRQRQTHSLTKKLKRVKLILSNSQVHFTAISNCLLLVLCFYVWNSSSNLFFSSPKLYLMSGFYPQMCEFSLRFYRHTCFPFPSLCLLSLLLLPHSFLFSTYHINFKAVKLSHFPKKCLQKTLL